MNGISPTPFNVSACVGWRAPSVRPTVPPIELVKSYIDVALTSDDHAEVCAMAAAILMIWRYSDPPETAEERAGLDLIADNYAAARARAEHPETAPKSLPSPAKDFVQVGWLLSLNESIPQLHGLDTHLPTGPGWTKTPCYIRTGE